MKAAQKFIETWSLESMDCDRSPDITKGTYSF